MEAILEIGYEKGNDRGDTSCISVLRRKGREYEVLRTIYGKEADELYNRLVGDD